MIALTLLQRLVSSWWGWAWDMVTGAIATIFSSTKMQVMNCEIVPMQEMAEAETVTETVTETETETGGSGNGGSGNGGSGNGGSGNGEPTPCADSNRQTTDTGECADDCNAGYSFNWYKKCVEDVDKPCSDYNRHGDTFFAGCGECLDGYVVHSTDASRCVSESESDLMTSLKDNWLIIGIVVVGLAAIAS